MKKIIAITLALTAFAAILSGCSGESDSSSSSPQSSQVQTTKEEESSKTLEDIQKIEQEYMDNGLRGALDAAIDRPYYIWFPKDTVPRHCACGYGSMPYDGILPICIAGSLEFSPEFDVDITQIKTNEDIIPVMTNSFAQLVSYADINYRDNAKIEISSTENKTVKDADGNNNDACYSKGIYSCSYLAPLKETKTENFQFVAYSLMWGPDTPFFVAVLDVSEEQNKLAECEEALEFMISTLREPDESEY